eukprot:1166279-Rhodomonas_salina.3
MGVDVAVACCQMGNKGAFIRLESDLQVPHTHGLRSLCAQMCAHVRSAGLTCGGGCVQPKFTAFTAVPHPAVRPMQYANMGGFNFMNFL